VTAAILTATLLSSIGTAGAQETGLAAGARQAREALARSADARRARRDKVIASWVLGGGIFDEEAERVVVRCGGSPCPPEVREQVLDRLAGEFRKLPAFLAEAKISTLYWDELPKGRRRGGTKDGHEIELRVPEGASIDDILCHEVAHIYEKENPETVKAFLKIRHDTPEFMEKLAGIWRHVMKTNNGSMAEPERLDGHGQRLVAEARIPRRHANDIHAITKSSEYWAVSVELAYLAGRDGGWERLHTRLDAAEIDYLKKLFAE
jgi:hypothetical protein